MPPPDYSTLPTSPPPTSRPQAALVDPQSGQAIATAPLSDESGALTTDNGTAAQVDKAEHAAVTDEEEAIAELAFSLFDEEVHIRRGRAAARAWW